MSTPKVSICIPVYNYGEYIADAIRSVLVQDYDDYELIIADNASTDHTPEVVKSFSDARISFIRHSENMGLAANLNFCLDQARGTYIAYLCADDFWHQGFLRMAVERLDDDPYLAFVHSAFCIVKNGSLWRRSVDYYSWPEHLSGKAAFSHILVGNGGVFLCSTLMRTPLVRSADGFKPALGFAGDVALFLRLCLDGDIGYLKDCFATCRLHGGNQTWSQYQHCHGFEDNLKLHEEVFGWSETKERISGYRALQRKSLSRLMFSTPRSFHTMRLHGARRADIWNLCWRMIKTYPLVLLSVVFWGELGISLFPERGIKLLVDMVTRIRFHRKRLRGNPDTGREA